MQYLLFFLIPFIISLIFTPIVRIIAIKKGLVAFPRVDRWHKKPTAILGGIVIYLSSIALLFFINTATAHVFNSFCRYRT